MSRYQSIRLLLTRCSGRPSARCWGWGWAGKVFPFFSQKLLRVKEKEQQEIPRCSRKRFTSCLNTLPILILGLNKLLTVLRKIREKPEVIFYNLPSDLLGLSGEGVASPCQRIQILRRKALIIDPQGGNSRR